MKRMKRLFSALLGVALLLMLLPPAAAKSDAWDGSVDISWYDPGKSEYYLSTPAQLAGLAALVNGMADPSAPKITGDKSCLKSIRVDDVLLVGAGGGNVSDTVYTSNIDFAYKTIYLTQDMDMGGRYDAATNTWSGPNWTPIGGKFPMKPQEAENDCLTLDTRFNGVLDGQGHTISDLYCDRYAAKGFPYSMAVGFVGFLGGACDNNENITADFENGWQPAVRNLVLASGSVYGRRMVGGIVGRVGETKNGVVIENCANRALVRNTDSKGVGGIVGSAWGSGIIRNCYNTGTIDTHGASCGRGIGGHDSDVYTVANCYYLTGCDDDADANGYYQGVSKKISVSCKAMREAEMRQESFVRALNANGAAFAADAAKKNGGYPVLWFENGGAESACAVSAGSVQHGTVSVSPSGTVTAGQTAELRAEAEAGWLFDYFTVNGKPLAGAFYTVTEDCTFGAVFKKVRTAKLEFTQGDGFYLAVRRTGWKYDDTGAMVYVTGEPVCSGDTLLEGNVLTLLTHEYHGAQPGDSALEYRSGVVYTVTNAEKNADGSYTVSADGTVGISGVRNTRGKTWASCADKSWYTGKQKSYTITTAEQLAGLAVLVNGGTDFSGVTLKLGADLSLERDSASGAQRSWTPIGTSINRAFRGTFDGQDHKITGLRACNEGSDSALFGCVSGASGVGGIVGVSYSGEDKIENCVNFGAVTGTKSGTYGTGGLAGRLAGTLTKSANYGAVTSADRYTGGKLCGYTDSDNVAVLSAERFTASGGEVRMTALRAPAVLLGSVTLKNCAVTAWGHSGSSAKVSAVYAGEKAIPAIREQSGVRWREALPFADVTADELWYDDAAFCYEKGWLKGTSDTAFSPDAPMTRAMFVTALYRAAGSPAVKADAPFTDLKADWYKNAVAWAAEAGVVQGTGRLTFSPDDALTLEQAAVLMQRYLKDRLTADEAAALPESAGAVSAWARGGVQWAYNAGLLREADLSAPAEAAGRVLLAQLLRRSAE